MEHNLNLSRAILYHNPKASNYILVLYKGDNKSFAMIIEKAFAEALEDFINMPSYFVRLPIKIDYEKLQEMIDSRNAQAEQSNNKESE